MPDEGSFIRNLRSTVSTGSYESNLFHLSNPPAVCYIVFMQYFIRYNLICIAIAQSVISRQIWRNLSRHQSNDGEGNRFQDFFGRLPLGMLHRCEIFKNQDFRKFLTPPFRTCELTIFDVYRAAKEMIFREKDCRGKLDRETLKPGEVEEKCGMEGEGRVEAAGDAKAGCPLPPRVVTPDLSVHIISGNRFYLPPKLLLLDSLKGHSEPVC